MVSASHQLEKSAKNYSSPLLHPLSRLQLLPHLRHPLPPLRTPLALPDLIYDLPYRILHQHKFIPIFALMEILITFVLSVLVFLFFHQNQKTMATQKELAQALVDLKAQLSKVATEITTKIQSLQDALANAGNTTPEVDAALDEVKSAVQALDDLNPDQPTE